MASKFKKGDRVLLNGRCPEFIYFSCRRRTRTIHEVSYDAQKRCCYYYLGVNRRGNSDVIDGYPFRSYMLKKSEIGGMGRPRTKRHYNRQPRQATPIPVVHKSLLPSPDFDVCKAQGVSCVI